MPEDVINKIVDRFESKLDKIVNDVNEMKVQIATITVQKEGQEKVCEMHSQKIDEHELRITSLEKRQVTQEASEKTNHDWIARLIGFGSMLYMFIKEWLLK